MGRIILHREGDKTRDTAALLIPVQYPAAIFKRLTNKKELQLINLAGVDIATEEGPWSRVAGFQQWDWSGRGSAYR